MGNYKAPTEGGSGGKRGHSSMEHWTNTEELKESSRIHRRTNSKDIINEELNALEEPFCDECGSSFILTASDYGALCPECAFWIYDHKKCEHEFINNRCDKCGWDGSESKYIKTLKNEKNT